MTSFDLHSEQDHFKEECAVFGVYGSSEAHVLTALDLHALQHRGQEATRMVSFDGKQFNSYCGLGHVGDNFNAGSPNLEALKGHVAIGHNRHSTTELSEVRNIQPFLTELAYGQFSIAHNGNLTNAARLRTSLVETPQFCDACFTGDYPIKESFPLLYKFDEKSHAHCSF
tara:strand:+ start:627 stop:1136 length:510 start_codon:yes stop_codon:yes gene_type:complete